MRVSLSLSLKLDLVSLSLEESRLARRSVFLSGDLIPMRSAVRLTRA